MENPRKICELHRLGDLKRLYGVELALQARGIETDVWGERGGLRSARGSGMSRLMVPCRDLVYARWVAYAAGLDTWPEEPSTGEGSQASARPAQRRHTEAR